MDETVILNREDIDNIIKELSLKIYQDIGDFDQFAIVGVQTRGVELAKRIQAQIETFSGQIIKSGILDITFYRDDLSTRGVLPVIKETRIDFNINHMSILLVDDVIYTGRTTKAALETLTSFGRPRIIRLFVLVDRGNREIPVQPDYCGHKIKTQTGEKVKVRLHPVDEGSDRVILSTTGNK